jgi:hypothetical protein
LQAAVDVLVGDVMVDMRCEKVMEEAMELIYRLQIDHGGRLPESEAREQLGDDLEIPDGLAVLGEEVMHVCRRSWNVTGSTEVEDFRFLAKVLCLSILKGSR